MRVKPRLLIIMPLAIIAVASLWFLSALHASYGFSVESRFSTVPPNDRQFEMWLKTQPGVVPHTVHVERAGEGETVLKVHFIQSRNLLGQPAFPALDQACHDFGYGLPVEKFRDSSYR